VTTQLAWSRELSSDSDSDRVLLHLKRRRKKWAEQKEEKVPSVQ
jgi:hypothetical protein